MCRTDLVIQLPQLQQCGWMLPQLQSRFKADRVDHKVGMDVVGIAMGSHQHFISRPSLRRKLQCDLMGLLVGDILRRREGLHILVKADALIFVPGCFGSFKLRDGIKSIAVDTTDETMSYLFIPSLFLLHAVFHDPLHITGPLSSFFDIGDGRQSITPSDPLDFFIDGSLQIDDLPEVVGVEHTGIDLGSNLVQIVADAF